MNPADPGVSAFVAANAGTGKTRLLIDRALRLMLSGADPARLLCLTFTNAAAAEMKIRLQNRLGAWVTQDDQALADELRQLEAAPSPTALAQARALFAQVLDLPGGIRIGTIHAFCQSLLRRFPLEASISPNFRLVEDEDRRAALEHAREAVLAGAHARAIEELAAWASADDFARLIAALQGEQERLGPALRLAPADLLAALCRAAEIRADSDAAIVAAGVAWPGEPGLREVLRLGYNQGSTSIRAKHEAFLGWLNMGPDDRCAHWDEWVKHFLNRGKPRGLGAFANKNLNIAHPQIQLRCAEEQARIAAIEDQRRGLAMAQATAALLRLAAPILAAYDGRKSLTGMLDYGDLIARTAALLKTPGAEWVLYKLDGGLDHLLLDEVQDTAPAQWEIARALTADFFAGSGTSDAVRTVFAVGDRKQSIYSFQGALPAAFDTWREHYQDCAAAAGLPFVAARLDTSYRSTVPVLALVDAVFADPIPALGVGEPGTVHHAAHRVGEAGAIELWPLCPRPDPVPMESWSVPDANATAATAPSLLAQKLAAWIRGQLGTRLESRGRALRAGDILVLVRRRDAFAAALVRGLKAQGVRVAGLDRMVLTEQPAVADLLGLCEALLLPDDDLAFAEYLTSPLGGLADADLMALAVGRDGSLWDALRRRQGERAAWAQAAAMFSTLLASADYVAPHATLAQALGPLGGRARLLARLGADAAEPIDVLLDAALRYAATHPPSLQGFTHWLSRSGAEVKREVEAAGDAVRIMTVHGAKGLQAPLVILPDTASLPPAGGTLAWTRDPRTGIELPLWAPRAELHCQSVLSLREAQKNAALQEYNRLLYVALTRAEDRLLVCGWSGANPPPEESWYRSVARAFAALGAEPADFAAWPGQTLRLASPQRAPVQSGTRPEPAPGPPLPAWAGQAPHWRAAPPSAEPSRPRPLSPSRPEGAALGPVPAARSPLLARGQARPRGALVHALLQHLPLLPPAARADAARAHLSRPAHGLGQADATRLAAQIMAVLEHEELAPLFGPGSRAEQPVAGMMGDRVVTGLVDRLAILPDRVLIADYKTNRHPPAAPDDVPVLYLRQMAAYRGVLAALHPGRTVSCVLVWTEGPVVTRLPEALLDRHRLA